MTRARSPQYPSLSLPQAIDLVAKLHKSNRTSVITRETAAKDMGYSGLTGRSLTVLAALAQFGLIEKAGKGDIKVTRRAVDILHSVDENDRTEAIQEAAFAPGLFQQLRDRFPEGVPSQNALRSYLIQMEFGDVAIGPAISAYLETNAFAENAKESGRSGADGGEGADSGDQPKETPMQPQQQPAMAPATVVPATLTFPVAADLNKINMDIRGDQVAISGLLDSKGLVLLEKKIAALKLLLAVYTEASDTEDDETVQ
ncbi:hypothetical protein [Sphingobium boeckii]|uniref:DUF5343 domain-containing protein n=1 Tax=Sphingobium boeckii TaxID=1082345 RepID=A0A7W9ALF9_9SPHN|nr:hypothetical protein [Sphingobium boeckii]MBB5687848.1 hypothetical protein [Sphingobium boeckii]